MTTPDTAKRYSVDLSHDALVALLICLEHVSGGGNSMITERPTFGEAIGRNASMLFSDITRQTGVVLEKIEPRDLTAEARALREKRCPGHVASLSGRCVLCGEAL